jgi:SAM-dependent methyltransferase
MSNETPDPAPSNPLAAWFGAIAGVEEALAAAQVWWLVWGAADTGLLDAARQPCTVEELATHTAASSEVVALACRALDRVGVFTSDDERFVLTPTWQALTDPSGFQPWTTAFGMVDARTRMLRDVFRDGGGYFGDDAADRLAYAKGTSPDPFRPGVGEMFRVNMSATPELFALLDRPCDFLELGCGVAGNLCSQLQGFPSMRAVGVELQPELADEARRRAVALGIDGRFEVVTADVTTFRRPSSFDVAFWSQMFFPTDSRAAALSTAYDSLRPGGLLMSPVMDPDEDETALTLNSLVEDIISTSWKVPAVRPDRLAAEFESAGFVDVHVVRRAASMLVVGHRPVSG